MVYLKLLQIVLVESYLYLWISCYQYFLKVVSTSQAETLRRSLFPAVRLFSMLFSFIALIHCFFLVFNFLFFWNVGWFSSLVINKNPIFNSYCRPVTLKAFFKFILNYQFLRKFRIKFFWWLDIFSFPISLLASPTK